MRQKKKLQSYYFNPRNSGSFSGRSRFIREYPHRVEKSTIGKWIQSEDAYTLHKPVRRKFPRLTTALSTTNLRFVD